jgi:hypothetical protein
MRRSASLVLLVAAVLFLAGCLLRGSNKTAKMQAPPAPPPPGRASAPAEPLSVPQTQVHLPPAQPLNQEALATEPEHAVVELPEPPTQPPPRRVPVTSTPALPRPESPAPAQVQGPPPAEPERPIVQEKITPEEQKRLTDQLAARKREIAANLEQAAARNPGNSEKELAVRIRSFVQLADEAASRGDLRQADALAERAQILSRELVSAR